MTKRKITKQEDLLNRIRALEGDCDDLAVAIGLTDTRLCTKINGLLTVVEDLKGRMPQPLSSKEVEFTVGAAEYIPKPVVRKWWHFCKKG